MRKRQDLPKGLWVVATPIGNLGDIGERARAAILEADAVLCEDTRRTAKLLAAIGAEHPMSRLERLDAHASAERIDSVIQRLLAGESLALVTDAGTPGISDPGAALVAQARDAGVVITPVPGPSAVTTLLSVAGIGQTAFTFRGFFPRAAKDRDRELERISGAAGISAVFVYFESPERIGESLRQIAERVPGSRIFAAKELTKLHERFFSGTALEVESAIREELVREGTRGEWCFVVDFSSLMPAPSATCSGGGEVELPARPDQDQVQQPESSDWVKALHCLVDLRISASDAAKQISRRFDVSRNEVYERALRLLGKK